MAEIQWGLLQQPDYFGNALGSYEAGQKQRSNKAKRNALAMYGTDPQGAINALRVEDPQMAFNLEDRGYESEERNRLKQERQTRKDVLSKTQSDLPGATKDAYAAGDPQLIDAVSKLTAEQRALKTQQTDEVSAVAFALRQSPYAERKPALQQLAPYLKERGFTDEQIATFDPSDANLDGVIAQGASLKELLQNAREDRTAASEQRRLDEQGRHNQAMERIGMTNAGANVTRANKKPASSSSSLPPPPGGWRPVGQ